jgi:hypothetical protein
MTHPRDVGTGIAGTMVPGATGAVVVLIQNVEAFENAESDSKEPRSIG